MNFANAAELKKSAHELATPAPPLKENNKKGGHFRRLARGQGETAGHPRGSPLQRE
jgi:hypothetical protein